MAAEGEEKFRPRARRRGRMSTCPLLLASTFFVFVQLPHLGATYHVFPDSALHTLDQQELRLVRPRPHRGSLSRLHRFSRSSGISVAKQKSAIRRQESSETWTVELDQLGNATWRGWGTSLAWFANFVGGLPKAQRDKVIDLLFSKTSGLGFTLVRYNIPGGLNATFSPRLAEMPFQAVPGFRQNPGGPYNWSADRNQRRVLQGGIQRGVNFIEGISYSPPWWSTVTRDVSGRPGGLPNLRDDMYEAFADYLADVVEYYHRVLRIPFAGLNPVNEPLAPWWTGNGSWWQEGCAFNLSGIERIYTLTRQALDKRGLTRTDIIGTDDWDAKVFQAYGRSKTLRDLSARISFHGYRVPLHVDVASKSDASWTLDRMDQVRVNLDKEVWQSEWGPMGLNAEARNTTSDLQLALIQARSICRIINGAGTSAFLYWQPVAPSGEYPLESFAKNYGLIRMSYNYSVPFKPKLTRQYYTQLQFSRAFPPGTKFLKVASELQRFVLVGYVPQKKQLAIAVVNEKSYPIRVKLSFGTGLGVKQLSERSLRTAMYRTSAIESNNRFFSGSLARSLSTIPAVALAQQSVTTIRMSNVALS